MQQVTPGTRVELSQHQTSACQELVKQLLRSVSSTLTCSLAKSKNGSGDTEACDKYAVPFGCYICERIVYRHGAILLILRECSGFNLGGVDIVDGVPGKEQVECGREEVEDEEKQERERNTKRQQTHAQTCDIMDGMWME